MDFIWETCAQRTGARSKSGASLTVYAEARRVETSRQRKRSGGHSTEKIFRGGLLHYAKARGDIERWLKQDQTDRPYLTTMFDLYALPGDFPGVGEAAKEQDPLRKAEIIERALARDLASTRFIPYVQVHEFEALLFCEPAVFSSYIDGIAAAVTRLAQVAASAASPEHIDDGAETAPSKRYHRRDPRLRSAQTDARPAGGERHRPREAAIAVRALRRVDHFARTTRRLTPSLCPRRRQKGDPEAIQVSQRARRSGGSGTWLTKRPPAGFPWVQGSAAW